MSEISTKKHKQNVKLFQDENCIGPHDHTDHVIRYILIAGMGGACVVNLEGVPGCPWNPINFSSTCQLWCVSE